MDVLELKEAVKIKDGESEAYISEIETISQAYEDMQTQNQHLLQQVAERDDYNIKAKQFSRRLIYLVATEHLPKQVEESKMDMPKEIFLKDYKLFLGTTASGCCLPSRYLDHNQFTGRIPDAFYKHTFLKEMYIERNAFRPGVNPIGVHNVLEVSGTEFLF